MSDDFTLGTKIRSKICHTLTGEIIQLYKNNVAVIAIKDRYLHIKEMVVCLENWDVFH